MKNIVFILSILLILGMGNVAYALSPEPAKNPARQQEIKQLVDEEKYTLYKELDNKIDEKLKSNISSYKEILTITIERLDKFYTILLSMALAVFVLNHFRLQAEVKKAVEIMVKKEVKNAKYQISIKFGIELNKNVSIMNKLISLEHAKRQLLLVVEDLEAPSIRHIPSKQAKDEIEHFLKEINSLKNNLEGLSYGKEEIKDIGDTNYNQEVAGKAYHYLGDKTEKGIENYKKAIEHFVKILDKVKTNKEFNKDKILLCLGNSYAGKNDYPEAIKQYDQIQDTSDDKFAAQVHISKGNAYKAMVKFHDAFKEFKKANDRQESYKDKFYYWESLYQMACSLVDKGEEGDYDLAEKKYNDLKTKENTFIEPTWLNITIGDFYRKIDGSNNTESENYKNSEKHYKLASAINSIGKDEAHYKLGRLYIDMKKYRDACTEFGQIHHSYLASVPIDPTSAAQEKTHHNDTVYKVNDSNKLLLFWGYCLIEKEKKTEGKDKINAAVKAFKDEADKKQHELDCKPNQDKPDYYYLICYPYYHLAMGLAMQDDGKDDAMDYLNRLISEFKFDFIKGWAKASNYSDFVKIKNDVDFIELVK